MPFVSNMDNEEQKSDQSPVPQGAVAPVGGGAVRLSPSSAVPSGGTGTSSGPASSPSAGGQFATLNQYLTANQGQAAPLANNIVGGINQQYNNLQQQNTQIGNDIQNQVTSAYTPNNPALLAQEAANPVSFSSNPQNVTQFKSLLNDTYSGPTTAESTPEYQANQTAINNAIATGQSQTGSEAGREQLLKSTEATPTTGVTALNSAILSQDPNYLSKVENAYQPFNNLLGNLSSSAKDIDNKIIQAQQESNAANTSSNAQINQQNAQLTKQLQDELSDAQAKTNQYNAAINKSTIQQNTVNPIYQNLLGAVNAYNQEAGNYGKVNVPTYGATSSLPTITLPGIGTIPAPITATPTQNTVATQDQLNLQNALNTIAGQNIATTLNPNAAVGGFQTPTAASIPTEANLFSSLTNYLQNELPAINQSYTANGTLAPAGTPAGNIVTAGQTGNAVGDVPSGYSIVPMQSVPAHGTAPASNAAVQQAIKNGTAIPLGNDPYSGQPYYAVPGQVMNTPAANKQPATYYPQTTRGNNYVQFKTGAHGADAGPAILPANYAAQPQQVGNLQNAYQQLLSILNS